MALGAPEQKDRDDKEKQEAPSRGRQNPILREYFLKQYDDIHSSPRFDAPPPFVDSFIDLQIDHFLSTVEEKLGRLSSNTQTLTEARSRWTSTPAESRPQLTKVFKQTLRLIENDAGDLRKTLSLIFVELKGKASSQPALEDGAGEPYAGEVQFIGDTVRAAEKRIRDYLFATDTTVNVGDLRDKNMLVLLDEARIVARKLQKRL